MTRSEKALLAALVSAGIVVPGVSNYFLASAGFDLLGQAVWVLGYLGTMLLIWFLWIRPLDLTGPS